MYRGKFESTPAAAKARKKAAAAAQTTKEVKKQPVSEAPKKKKGPKRHTIVFYSIYAVCIVAFFFGLSYVMGLLDEFLVKYEASQPDVMSREVFDELFETPDWSSLYDLAGMEGTVYDGKDSFVAYMQHKVGEEDLTFVETSMGLSQDKKFYVRMGEENVAAFTLTNGAEAVAIPEWELASVEVYVSYDQDVTIQSYPGCTVSVNGVALDDSHIIRTTETAAEQYLPEGLHGARSVTYYLDGLLVAPTVTVTDESGTEMTLSYDEQTNTYSHTTGSTAITQAQTSAFEAASEAYGKFMIADLSKQGLAKYFTGNSYDAIIQAELAWMQNFSGYEFGELELTEFYAYSDTWCSARVHQILYVTRGNGTVKEYEINSTFFMEKQTRGWMVVEMTNASVQDGTSQVRLTYMQEDTQLESLMVDTQTKTLTPPAVTAPEGKVFAGWFTRSVNEEGKTVLTLVFQPDENGQVSLPAGYELEPMVLYARFENEGVQ